MEREDIIREIKVSIECKDPCIRNYKSDRFCLECANRAIKAMKS